jgi:hypothetical protein
MDGMFGSIGVSIAAVATLAVGVMAGFALLQATLRLIEACVPKPANGSVTEFAEFARRSTGPLAPSSVELELERAA